MILNDLFCTVEKSGGKVNEVNMIIFITESSVLILGVANIHFIGKRIVFKTRCGVYCQIQWL